MAELGIPMLFFIYAEYAVCDMLALYLLVGDMLDIMTSNHSNLKQCGIYHAIWDLEGVNGFIPKIKRSPYDSRV